MPQFRKKPVVIEAAQWFKNGDHPLDYSKTYDGFENGELRQFSPEERKAKGWEGDIVRYYRNPDDDGQRACQHCGKTMHEHGWIDTLKGGHIVCPGDWIITGVEGERYSCKPNIFEKTYDPVAPASSGGNTDRMLQFFAYAHLPEALQAHSEPFHRLAQVIVDTLPANAERTAALRKLLEAKDCAVRARVYQEPEKAA